MAIRESWVPCEGWRYEVAGDRPFRYHSSREAAEEREAELTGADTADTDGGE